MLFSGALSADAQHKIKTKPKPVEECRGTNDLTSAETAQILADHNRIRAENGLTPLTWDCKLADQAQEWAKRGIFEHRSDNPYGENLFVSSDRTESVESAFQHWMAEKANWSNDTGVCQTGKICNHYTQIVWRATDKIGCGINRNGKDKWPILMVCNYSPAGNKPGRAY